MADGDGTRQHFSTILGRLGLYLLWGITGVFALAIMGLAWSNPELTDRQLLIAFWEVYLGAFGMFILSFVATVIFGGRVGVIDAGD